MLSLCALFASWSVPCFAQTAPATDVPPVHLILHPMAASVPALKYQLLPELKEMNPGNAVQGFMKCFMEQQSFFFAKESQTDRDKWNSAPLTELRSQNLLHYGDKALIHADYAARLDSTDWQVLLRARTEGYNLPMPEVQQFRMLAVALKVRFRAEVAEGRFDDAVRTAKTMLALARSSNEYPGIIPNLIGAAIAAITFNALEEMIQQPGCPNLYWALTTLPSPLIDNRKGLQGEAVFAAAEFNGLDSAAPMSTESLEKMKTHLSQVIGGSKAEQEQKQLKAWMVAQSADAAYLQAARSRLIASGASNERVQNLPALQVVLLDEKREYEVRMDEGCKWMPLTFWQAAPALRAVNPNRKADHMLAEMFLPPFLKLRMAQARSDRPIALLRQVEAIRMYAADHDGKLPARLEDLTVPVPIDPIHGKPFDYKIEGDSAVLRAPSPVGFEAAPSLHYILTIKK
jgi:hypothetical protein